MWSRHCSLERYLAPHLLQRYFFTLEVRLADRDDEDDGLALRVVIGVTVELEPVWW